MSLENLTVQERQQLALGGLTRKLVDNPATAAAAKRLLMQADPSVKFPEIELDDKLSAMREKTAEETQALRDEVKRLKAEQKQAALHQKVKDAGHDVKDVITLLEKHGMPSTDENYDLALDVLSSRADVLAESTAGDFAPPTAESEADTQAMWNDPIGWRQKQAAKVLSEMGVGRRRFRTG